LKETEGNTTYLQYCAETTSPTACICAWLCHPPWSYHGQECDTLLKAPNTTDNWYPWLWRPQIPMFTPINSLLNHTNKDTSRLTRSLHCR